MSLDLASAVVMCSATCACHEKHYMMLFVQNRYVAQRSHPRHSSYVLTYLFM